MRTVTISAIAVAAALAGGAATTASADTGGLADFDLGLTSRRPAAPTGMSVHIFLHREHDPDQKPSPLRSAVVRGPEGLRFDPSAAPLCMATDEELRARGSDACPAETRLALGSFSAIFGFGPPIDPSASDLHVFNAPGQLLEVVTFKGASPSPAWDRVTYEGATLTAHPPSAPGGPPEGEASVRSLDYSIPAALPSGRSFVTTPPECPADGFWRSSATFGFADGTSDTVASSTPCDPSRAQADSRLSLTARPRSVAAGVPVRVRLRVRSQDPRCIAGAKLRLGRDSVLTDESGRAEMTVTFHRPGLHRPSAGKRGCVRGTATVRVRPPRRGSNGEFAPGRQRPDGT